MRKTYLGNEGAMKMKKSIAWKYLAVCAALLTHHGTAAAQNNADESAYQAPAETDDITDQVTDTSEPSAPASLVLSGDPRTLRSEEHTSELQSRGHLVCRLLLEKKNKE